MVLESWRLQRGQRSQDLSERWDSPAGSRILEGDFPLHSGGVKEKGRHQMSKEKLCITLVKP